MPFKSQAQRRWMYANKPAMAKRWSEHTPNIKNLPERKRRKVLFAALKNISKKRKGKS